MAKVQLSGPTAKGATLQRVRYATQLFVQMLPMHVILEKLKDKFQCTDYQANRALELAKMTIAAEPPPDAEDRRAQLRAAFGVAYVECMAKGSHGPAIRALRELALLDGLYPGDYATSRLLNGSGGSEADDVASTSADKVRARMAELLAKHATTVHELMAKGVKTDDGKGGGNVGQS